MCAAAPRARARLTTRTLALTPTLANPLLPLPSPAGTLHESLLPGWRRAALLGVLGALLQAVDGCVHAAFTPGAPPLSRGRAAALREDVAALRAFFVADGAGLPAADVHAASAVLLKAIDAAEAEADAGAAERALAAAPHHPPQQQQHAAQPAAPPHPAAAAGAAAASASAAGRSAAASAKQRVAAMLAHHQPAGHGGAGGSA